MDNENKNIMINKIDVAYREIENFVHNMSNKNEL